MPVMKDLVPSIGSSTQTYSASARSLPYSSPTMPCAGKVLLDQRPHRVFGCAVGRRHRIEAGRRALVLDAERGAEERQDRIARRGRELVDEGREIDGRHVSAARGCGTGRHRRRRDGPATHAADLRRGAERMRREACSGSPPRKPGRTPWTTNAGEAGRTTRNTAGSMRIARTGARSRHSGRARLAASMWSASSSAIRSA